MSITVRCIIIAWVVGVAAFIAGAVLKQLTVSVAPPQQLPYVLTGSITETRDNEVKE